VLVGDIIIGCRELIPDLPRSVASPVAGVGITAAVAAAAGSSLLPGTYYAVITASNQWGEAAYSAVAAAGPFVVGANQGINITAITGLPPGANSVWIYLGYQSGGPYTIAFGPFASTSTPILLSTAGIPKQPPTRSTAYYPDSDGTTFSAYTVYRWLQEAMEEASKICGGIPDNGGLQTQLNMSQYVINGIWSKFDHAWWDGYPVGITGRDDLFLRNVLTGYPRSAVLQYSADRQVFELQPQPNRAGGFTTLAAPMGISDGTASLTSFGGFLLPLGMMQIGTEYINFGAVNGTTVQGIVRGLGGSTQQAWPMGTPVYELNFHWAGMRQITPGQLQYLPGQSGLTMPLPPSWKTALIEYMLYRANMVQKLKQEADGHFQMFHNMMNTYMRGNKQVAGPRQVGGQAGSGSLETYQGAGPFRIIIP
jgi:hypothetical protein